MTFLSVPVSVRTTVWIGQTKVRVLLGLGWNFKKDGEVRFEKKVYCRTYDRYERWHGTWAIQGHIAEGIVVKIFMKNPATRWFEVLETVMKFEAAPTPIMQRSLKDYHYPVWLDLDIEPSWGFVLRVARPRSIKDSSWSIV